MTHEQLIPGTADPRVELSPAMAAGPVLEFTDELARRDMRLHSLLVHRHGETVLDFWQWPHGPELKHKLHSATKSFTATAVGFAEAEGLLSLDDPVIGFFADRLPAVVGENLALMRIRDLLTMRTGHARGLSGATTRRLTVGWVEEFLAEPVVERPGRNFVYSSTTSHMLSAIVQKVTGLPVSEYLKPRLFEPLGIRDLAWEQDPEGISSGGNGLSLRPRDLLSFGVLCLQDGVWNGERVLPADWVQKASALHVRQAISGVWNGTELVAPGPDAVADSGYGYQFWVSEDGIYSASGIFGQECMVFPHHDAVVVVMGAMGGETYHDLPEMLRSTFRRAFDDAAVSDPADDARLAGLIPAGRAAEALDPAARRVGFAGAYDFEPNEQALNSLSVEVGAESVVVTLDDDYGTHRIEHGLGRWVPQQTTASVWRLHHSYQDPIAPIAAAAEWAGGGEGATPGENGDVLNLTWHFLESPFIDRLSLAFDADGITVHHGVNVNSGPTELPPARGRLRA